MRRKLQEILCDAETESAEEIKLVIDELDNFKEQLKALRIKKLEDELYKDDDNTPYWQK